MNREAAEERRGGERERRLTVLMEIEEPDAGCSVEEAAEHWKRNEKEALDMARSWNREHAMK